MKQCSFGKAGQINRAGHDSLNLDLSRERAAEVLDRDDLTFAGGSEQ